MTDSIFPAGAEPILPILPLRNSVLFPATVVPVNVGRARSVRLIEEACGRERPAIGVVTQHKPEVEDPTFDQVYHTGTIARVLPHAYRGSPRPPSDDARACAPLP
jgi:ATP-dependent Lon protease